jgi:hypothetical protein
MEDTEDLLARKDAAVNHVCFFVPLRHGALCWVFL